MTADTSCADLFSKLCGCSGFRVQDNKSSLFIFMDLTSRLNIGRVAVLILFGWAGICSALMPWHLLPDVFDHAFISKPELSRRPSKRALAFGKSIVDHRCQIAFEGLYLERLMISLHLAGDYAEISGACPARTTCPLVCVANATDCPTICNDGLLLCNDGICSESCDDGIETPCECDGLPVACAKVVDFYDVCFERFQSFYDTDSECLEAASDEIPLFFFTEPPFIFCYVWISAVTVLVYLWCLTPNP